MFHEKIRIGTMVSCQDKAEYIRQILPHGFESFSLSWWQSMGKTDLKSLAKEVKTTLADTGAVISSLSVFGNPLGVKPIDAETRDGWKKAIDAAKLFGCDIVTGFAGRIIDKPICTSVDRYAKIFGPLAKRAADQGVRLAFENCQMGGNWNTGDWNMAQSPDAWELMFEAIDSKNIGLQWEPCHQMVALIDPIPQLRKWVKKVFCVHGKDATINWDTIREHGIHGPIQWCFHRSPGFGDSNWTDIITILRQGGFEGSIDIEGWHDPVYREELEMTGQVHALNYLKRCRGGTFVPNPTAK
jgi:sugar phosphate isomerase/epimerase